MNPDTQALPSFPGLSRTLSYSDGHRDCLMVRIRPDAVWPTNFNRSMEDAGWYLLVETGQYIRQYVRTWEAPLSQSVHQS